MNIEYYKKKTETSPWMSIQELADRMEVSIRQVRRLYAKGIGPSIEKT